MTLENFKYRTNPMFLRNQFTSDNLYCIPELPLVNLTRGEIDDLKLIAFNNIKFDNGKNSDRFVHFFFMTIILKNYGYSQMNK